MWPLLLSLAMSTTNITLLLLLLLYIIRINAVFLKND